ncbi:response regulator, partial [Ectopseudomonas khazarica]
MRVLILEDDPWIADLLKQIVQNLHPSTQIESVTRLADALDAWKRQPAQLVIADWNLPDGPGTSLLEVAHRSDASVPLVMITARSDRDSVLLARRLGINAFISKPFQVPKVLETLRPLL